MKKKNIETLTSLTALSVAIGTQAEGAMVAASLPPGGLVTPSWAGVVYWDIDGGGSNDFKFSLTSSSFFSTYYSSTSINSQLSVGELAGRFAYSSAGNSNALQKLDSGTSIGTYATSPFIFRANGINAAMLSAYSSSVYPMAFLSNGGWNSGDTGYFGFQFTDNGDTHYGWAEMTVSSTIAQITINEAWYNDTPDADVIVGAVPEPAHIALGLGALALGAAGLRRMRQTAA